MRSPHSACHRAAISTQPYGLLLLMMIAGSTATVARSGLGRGIRKSAGLCATGRPIYRTRRGQRSPGVVVEGAAGAH